MTWKKRMAQRLFTTGDLGHWPCRRSGLVWESLISAFARMGVPSHFNLVFVTPIHNYMSLSYFMIAINRPLDSLLEGFHLIAIL